MIKGSSVQEAKRNIIMKRSEKRKSGIFNQRELHKVKAEPKKPDILIPT